MTSGDAQHAIFYLPNPHVADGSTKVAFFLILYMHVTTLSIPPATSGARGPCEYLLQEVDGRGNLRQPAPKRLHGDLTKFEFLVARSEATNRYLSYVLSYKGEERDVDMADRNAIHKCVLTWFSGGLRDECLVAIGVDHGDHEHGALLRELVDPPWPRFQPYYHPVDWGGRSDLQWLINNRYALRAPEDPRNSQLVSLAGKHFSDEDLEWLHKLRTLIRIEELKGIGIACHSDFRKLLFVNGCNCDVVRHPRADVGRDTGVSRATDRVWMKVTRPDQSVVLIKGPVCSERFCRDDYQRSQQERVKKYDAFVANPYELWERLLGQVRMRHARMRKRLAKFMDPACDQGLCGFEDLHPSRHLRGPGHKGVAMAIE